jgi:hypothetical protein
MIKKKPRASALCTITLAFTALSVHAEPEAQPAAAPTSSVAAAVPANSAPATQDAALQTRLRFSRGALKPGIEGLRVVRRENTINNVAGQVATSVAASVLSGGIAIGGNGFSKGDLAGTTLEELKDDPVAVNPALNDLNDALSRVATDIYRGRVAAARATALQDGSTPEEIEDTSKVPVEADTPLHPGAWHLVYENLAGSDELYRLNFGAELGRPGFMRPPAACAYQSEPIAWTQWQADHWQRLREERVKAVAYCTAKLAATPEKFW